MYKHLLIPIDGSPLSSATIENAVAYANSIGAQVTFFHARPDYASTGEGALMHAASPKIFAEAAAGNAQAILARAEAAARAAGLYAQTLVVTSDRPHEAILKAAESQGCDLVFMSSRGRRGWRAMMHGSVTHKVLQETTLPVLVAAVESNLPASDELRALTIIKNEHRSLAAVINGLQHVINESIKQGNPPDFELLRAMLYYIEEFPERLHHPKEDSYLFHKLRERCTVCDALITELEQQHVEGARQFASLRTALAAYEAEENSADRAESFRDACEDYARSLWEHMGAEEKLVLPAASRHLTAEDWKEIANAFGENGDPRFDLETDASFEKLFERLMNHASGELQRVT